MKLPFKAPKLSLPFGKRAAGDAPDSDMSASDVLARDAMAINPLASDPLPGDDGSHDSDAGADRDAFAFEAHTDKSETLKRRLPWIAVIGGYVATAAALGGVAFYLILSADQIEQEMIEARPKAEVAGDQIVVRRVGETSDIEAAVAAAVDAVSGGDDSDPGEGLSVGAEDPPAPDLFADTLAPHPDPGLIAESEFGPLPVIGEDGRRAWQVYSRPSNPLETRPKIAVVVTDLGVSARRVEAAIALPGPITLAFAPYARKVGEWIDQARANGHEVMLTLPLEPTDFPKSDPGPFALMSGFDPDQNIRRLHWVLSRVTGYVGLVSYQGGSFAANPESVRPMFDDLRTRGLIYLDGRQAAASTVPRIARATGVPVSQADILIDGSFGRAHVLQRLRLAESLASANGSVIVLAKPYPMTLERLRIWSEDLDANGYALIPASAVISERFAS